MTDWKVLSIVIGVIGSLFGVYFRESLRRAYQRKDIAVRLEVYVRDLIDDMLKSEFKEIFALAEVWRNERMKAFASGGIKNFNAVNEKYEKLFEQVKELIQKDNDKIGKQLISDHKLYREMPEKVFNYHNEQLELTRTYLMENKNFISDKEAAAISWDVAHRVVEIRGAILKLIRLRLSYALIMREMEQFEASAVKDMVSSIIEHITEISMHLIPLTDKAEKIRRSWGQKKLGSGL